MITEHGLRASEKERQSVVPRGTRGQLVERASCTTLIRPLFTRLGWRTAYRRASFSSPAGAPQGHRDLLKKAA